MSLNAVSDQGNGGLSAAIAGEILPHLTKSRTFCKTARLRISLSKSQKTPPFNGSAFHSLSGNPFLFILRRIRTQDLAGPAEITMFSECSVCKHGLSAAFPRGPHLFRPSLSLWSLSRYLHSPEKCDHPLSETPESRVPDHALLPTTCYPIPTAWKWGASHLEMAFPEVGAVANFIDMAMMVIIIASNESKEVSGEVPMAKPTPGGQSCHSGVGSQQSGANVTTIYIHYNYHPAGIGLLLEPILIRKRPMSCE
ncbi:uncharacterized protein CLUP02_13122 [Colletotrichum lupini]|uniref:Uncharacterized protein n=1 Tax=Colletotrichum lupini TaxID=145971 RepID=A0A9Q8T1Q7_9PEZI|nr:uncharacterized protein CLUP02_13122 [Colletotrichum lupini]UQC87604.1 hypothetical protein CLUP02_13122 [Colletotrichum lupini]